MSQHSEMWQDAQDFIAMLSRPQPPEPPKPAPRQDDHQAEREVTEAIVMCYR
ncbi:MAG: hypothetical protein M3Q29_20070 [Chloroflexota bacterium]|nr:hypothetical protein [Chloroflexota bacterium]